MIYDRRFGLPQSIANYLNQPLPNISGIFSLPQASEILSSPQQESVSSSMLTPEQLALLYPQYFSQSDSGGGDGGDGRDETDYLNRIDNNAGIYSLKDLKNYALSLPTAARIGGLAFGPFGFAAGLIGTSIADRFGFTQAGRDRKAREEAAARGAAKQARASAIAQEAANRDYARNTGGDGGRGPGETSSGTFGSSTNDAGFSDYS